MKEVGGNRSRSVLCRVFHLNVDAFGRLLYLRRGEEGGGEEGGGRREKERKEGEGGGGRRVEKERNI